MKNKKLLLLFFLCLSTGIALGQMKVTGNVTDNEGNPVIGASVVAKGGETTDGTITDTEGNFSFNAPAGSKTLEISYVGFKTQILPIKSSIQVIMEEDATALKEIEITAEFGMKRIARSVGSSTQMIKGSDISESGRESFVNALQGRVAGIDRKSTRLNSSHVAS